MNCSDDCADCKRLARSYESVTIEWFRVQGQLRIASFSRDQTASDRIVAELTGIGQRREQLRRETDDHVAERHPRAACASSPV